MKELVNDVAALVRRGGREREREEGGQIYGETSG
jgi:hypothetical protein